jgi:hypothetical protein
VKLTLNLTVSAAASRSDAEDAELTAVLIFGRTAAEWLLPICRCRIATSQLIFLPLSNPGSGEVFGAIVAGAGLRGRVSDLQRQTPLESTDLPYPVVGYRCLAERLFIPGDAALSPRVTDEELQRLLPVSQDHRLVWHPAVGLLEYEKEDVLSAVDLLAGPVWTGRVWNSATAGEQLNLTIRSLKPVIPPESVFQSLQEGAGDIGSAAADIGSAPRAPNELPETKLDDALDRLKRQVAKVVHRITDRLPSSPDGSELLGRLHAWAESLVGNRGSHSSANRTAGSAGAAAAASADLSTRQENELKRLLHMLEQQPEEGLKYALPLGEGDFRGMAPPTDQLSAEAPDFDLGKMNRSGPASVWQVSSGWRDVLSKKYRELAQRELRLGNHRRAAYIYAMLLHDLHAAASVLDAGRQYRDAASIYQVHLKLPNMAAHCLKRGGLWEEAAVIFRELRQWREAAELYRLLDRPEQAAGMYEQLLQQLLNTNQRTAAADVALDCLGDRSRSQQLLRDGWRSDVERAECLRRLFQQHADAGEHQLMETDLQTLVVNATLSAAQQDIAVAICSELATKYPAARVRDLLRLQTWQTAATMLARNPAQPSQIAVRAIQNLAAQDELLQRDAARCGWQSRLPVVDSAPGSTGEGHGIRTDSRRKELQAFPAMRPTAPNLPDSIRWKASATSSEYLFCLGETLSEQLVVARWSLRELEQGRSPGSCVSFPVSDPRHFGSPQLRLIPGQPERVNLQFFPASADSVRGTVREVVRGNSFVGTTALIHALTIDLGHVSDGSRYSLGIADSDTVELELADRQNNSLVSFPLLLPEQMLESLIECGGRVWLENSKLLVFSGALVCCGQLPAVQRLDKAGPTPIWLERLAQLDSEFVTFLPSQPLAVPRVLVQTQTSCFVVWLDSSECICIADNLRAPRVCWTRSGIVVVGEADRLSCYRVTRKNIQFLASVNISGKQIISLQADHTPDHVLVLYENGELQRICVPIE